jgi:hypothetical protein
VYASILTWVTFRRPGPRLAWVRFRFHMNETPHTATSHRCETAQSQSCETAGVSSIRDRRRHSRVLAAPPAVTTTRPQSQRSSGQRATARRCRRSSRAGLASVRASTRTVLPPAVLRHDRGTPGSARSCRRENRGRSRTADRPGRRCPCRVPPSCPAQAPDRRDRETPQR